MLTNEDDEEVHKGMTKNKSQSLMNNYTSN